MQFTQVLKTVLRLVGLGAEPADSAPMVLSSEVQRSISLLTGKHRNNQIPVNVNPAGGIQVLPPYLDDVEIQSGALASGVYTTFAKPYDLVYFTGYGAECIFQAKVNGVEVNVPNMSAYFMVDAGLNAYAVNSAQIAGNITGISCLDIGMLGVLTVKYTAIRFNHGRE